jgi:transcriptional regulator with XRE-family HTH domain
MNGTDLRQILSKNIKLLRSQKSLSQIELAEKADISIPFLSNIERSNKWPHPDTLTKIAAALEVEVYELFQENFHSLSEDAQKLLEQYQKDLAVSLQKSISAAVYGSLENITSCYLKNDNE